MINITLWHSVLSPDIFRGLSDSATGSLLAAIWQGTLLAAAAALGLRLLPKTPAAARFAIWFAVFLLVAGLPLLAFWAHPASTGTITANAPRLTLNSSWSQAILVLWVAASLARAITLVIAAFRVRALWNRATPLAPGQIPRSNLETLNPASLGRPAEICTTNEVDRPSVIGFFSPKILIPTWLVEKLSPEEMTHVILHEAGHLRRADDWLNLLQKIALVLFPLNPALIWVERRLCFERELACDDRVLRATRAPIAYASCLATLAEHRMTRRGLALVMGALGRESDLGQRVLRILARGDRMRPAHTRLIMAGAVVTLVAGTAALERTPQLIGFASTTGTQQTAVNQPAPAVKPPAHFSYQPVVFHPLHVAATPANPTAGQGSASAHAFNNAPPKPAETHPSHSRSSASVPDASGWVLMTSTTTWSGSGANVVMTSIRTSTPFVPNRNAATRLRSDVAPSIPSPTAATQSALQQVYPYAAAVPVRGGWLIIQL